MSARVGSTIEIVWRVTRDAVVRLNHLLAETGNSDNDLVFHIRRSQSDEEASDQNRARLRADRYTRDS
ncbi:MAG TPA: hypothetical protein VGG77_07325 [Roseiarcus sp.]|jgi:hypothetical protein